MFKKIQYLKAEFSIIFFKYYILIMLLNDEIPHFEIYRVWKEETLLGTGSWIEGLLKE